MNLSSLTYAQLSHAAFCGQITYAEMDAELARRDASLPAVNAPAPAFGVVLAADAYKNSACEVEIRRRIECLRIAIGAAFTTSQHTFNALVDPWNLGDPNVVITLGTAHLLMSCRVDVRGLSDPVTVPGWFNFAARAMRRRLSNP